MIRFLVNPQAGRGRGSSSLPQLRRMAEAVGATFRVCEDVQDLVRQARRAAAEGVERLIVVGGDGTVHHASQALAGTACALGIVPAGTGNDLARTLRIPSDLESAVETAVQGRIRAIDLGRIGDRFYVSVAGAGFHGEVVRYADERVRLLRGPLVYPYAVLRTVAFYKPPFFRVHYDGGTFEDRAWLAVLANGPRFGGGMQIAPRAVMDDGLLDLVIVKQVSPATLLRIFPRVYGGRHVEHPAVVTTRTSQATIQIDRPVIYYGDGEPLIRTEGEPVTIGVCSGGLRVAVEGEAS